MHPWSGGQGNFDPLKNIRDKARVKLRAFVVLGRDSYSNLLTASIGRRSKPTFRILSPPSNGGRRSTMVIFMGIGIETGR